MTVNVLISSEDFSCVGTVEANDEAMASLVDTWDECVAMQKATYG